MHPSWQGKGSSQHLNVLKRQFHRDFDQQDTREMGYLNQSSGVFEGLTEAFCPRTSAAISARTSAGYPAPETYSLGCFFIPELDAAFFALQLESSCLQWSFFTYSGRFLLFTYSWSFFAFSFSFFTYSWSFFAYSGKLRLIRALRDCKQRSLTVSKKAPTVSKKASPEFVDFQPCRATASWLQSPCQHNKQRSRKKGWRQAHPSRESRRWRGSAALSLQRLCQWPTHPNPRVATPLACYRTGFGRLARNRNKKEEENIGKNKGTDIGNGLPQKMGKNSWKVRPYFRLFFRFSGGGRFLYSFSFLCFSNFGPDARNLFCSRPTGSQSQSSAITSFNITGAAKSGAPRNFPDNPYLD